MKERIERSNPREQQESPILILTEKDYSAYMKNKYYYTYAKMFNFDKGGLYFESDCAYQPGSNISIRMDETVSDVDMADGAYKVHYGRVMWCREKERDDCKCYGVGVQIFETVVQAEIH